MPGTLHKRKKKKRWKKISSKLKKIIRTNKSWTYDMFIEETQPIPAAKGTSIRLASTHRERWALWTSWGNGKSSVACHGCDRLERKIHKMIWTRSHFTHHSPQKRLEQPPDLLQCGPNYNFCFDMNNLSPGEDVLTWGGWHHTGKTTPAQHSSEPARPCSAEELWSLASLCHNTLVSTQTAALGSEPWFKSITKVQSS